MPIPQTSRIMLHGSLCSCLHHFDGVTAILYRWANDRWDDVAFVVGADEFCHFLDWKDPDGLLEHARLLVASRPGFPHERLDRVLAGLARPERVEFFEIQPLPISSREIRSRVARGEPIDDLVLPAVANLIEELGLYRTSEGS